MSSHAQIKQFRRTTKKKWDFKNMNSVWHDTTSNAWTSTVKKSFFGVNSTLHLLRSFVDDALHFCPLDKTSGLAQRCLPFRISVMQFFGEFFPICTFFPMNLGDKEWPMSVHRGAKKCQRFWMINSWVQLIRFTWSGHGFWVASWFELFYFNFQEEAMRSLDNDCAKDVRPISNWFACNNPIFFKNLRKWNSPPNEDSSFLSF